MNDAKYNVWWIPQVPGPAFNVEVSTIAEGRKILEVLAHYDLFQFENRIKPDYCNAGGLSMWDPDADGPGKGDWYDVDPDDEEE